MDFLTVLLDLIRLLPSLWVLKILMLFKFDLLFHKLFTLIFLLDVLLSEFFLSVIFFIFSSLDVFKTVFLINLDHLNLFLVIILCLIQHFFIAFSLIDCFYDAANDLLNLRQIRALFLLLLPQQPNHDS